jgi:hypothetical protein
VHYPAIGYIASLAHELGHNMGCMHEPGNNTGNGTFPYSQGFVDSTNKFWTVMAYGTSCQGAGVPVDQFSSPINFYQGHPAGKARGLADIAVLDLQSSATSFRTTGVPLGTYYMQIRAKNACGTSAPGLSLQIVVVPQL